MEKTLVCSVLTLILQSHFCWSQTLLVPSQPIIVPVGSHVTLPCQLDPVQNMKDQVVEWARHDLKPRYVHIWHMGWNHLFDQNSLYLGRTELSERGLQVGDMSLQLSRVRLSDGGTYRCFVPQMDTGAEVTLSVVSVSPVSVSLNKDHSGSPVLRCESRGWYPEPELVWLDSEGTVLTGARTEVQRGASDETFSVSSRLSVEHSPGNTFTCRVRHEESRQSREAQINITGEFLEVSSCSVAWTFFSLGLLLLIAAAVAFIVWKFKLLNRNKSENKDAELGEKEETTRMINHKETTNTVKSLVNDLSLELKSTEHNENLEKIQDQQSFVHGVIYKLTLDKELLKEIKEKMQNVIDVTKFQLNVEKKTTFQTSDRKKEQAECIRKLEKLKEECEATVQRLDQQSQTLHSQVLEAAQRKGQLEQQLKSEEKLMQKEKRRPEASVRPEEVKVNVPVATVHALNQTQEAQDQKEPNVTDDVDELTRAMGSFSKNNENI